jgi:hypothetical protein
MVLIWDDPTGPLAWQAYIKLELRYNEFDRASMIYERWIGTRPEPKNWITWSRYEEDRGKPGPSLFPPACLRLILWL